MLHLLSQNKGSCNRTKYVWNNEKLTVVFSISESYIDKKLTENFKLLKQSKQATIK